MSHYTIKKAKIENPIIVVRSLEQAKIILKECKYIVKERKISKYIIDDIENSSDSDRENFDRENYDENIQIKKILMKEILTKKI